LSHHGVSHALIGAAALAIHGVSRSTADQDLLVVDARVIDDAFWGGFGGDARVDVRRGDADDPLAGVVRIAAAGERNVDVVVGRHGWQHDLLQRAAPIQGGLRVVEPADLILLKLFAGGSQDRWDIEQLLALDRRGVIGPTVDARVGVLPTSGRTMWSDLRGRSCR
jgi:hypothetical protein